MEAGKPSPGLWQKLLQSASGCRCSCTESNMSNMQKLSKAIKSSKPWSRDESMEILRSKFCALWRSWPPRRLDRSCSMASGSFGCSECCTLAVTRKCFELKGALKIAMHHRDLYRPSVLSKQEHKKSRKREAIQMIHDDSGRA